MKANALICDEKQRFSIEEVTLPNLKVGTIVVKTLYSGVSIGTEFALIRNKISWGPYPICTGYQAVGEVLKVGKNVKGYQVGDKVYFRDSKGMKLSDGTAVSSVTGTHSSHAVIDPENTIHLAKLPEGAPLEPCSMFVMPAVGLLGVDMSKARMGDVAVVYGVGLIGIGVVAALSGRGCYVVAVDIDEARLDMAREFGADALINGSRQNVAKEVRKIAPGGADVVFEATGIPECLDQAVPLCRTEGTFVFQGNYGEAPISMHFLPAHARRLTAVFPCNDGLEPCRRAVVKAMTKGTLPWEKAITHRVPWQESAEVYDRINKGKAPEIIGAVVDWTQ